jgi:uncharacterized membrane protein
MTLKSIVKNNPLFFAFLFPAAMDGLVTLTGQDASYWTNRIVNEGSPAYYFLLASPLLFIAGSLVWFIFWYWSFKRLKEPLNLFLMFLFIAGHSWGSTSWLWRMMRLNGIYTMTNQLSVMTAWLIAIAYFVVIAASATYCLSVYIKTRGSKIKA